MTPANLHDAVREAYARGKESDDSATIEQAIAWGRVDFDMTMTDVVREEILSTVARAQIRVGKWKDADETIAFMQGKGYRSVTFLEGHSLLTRRNLYYAIPKPRSGVATFPQHKAPVHAVW